jgi:hypothetical protein
MRRVLAILTLIAFSAVVAQAYSQGPGQRPEPGDQDDDSPAQSGYAVITPTGGASTGLVVFETFGLRGNGADGGASQAGVLPAALTTNTVLFVESSGWLSKNLGIAIVNPNASNANLTITLRKSDGTELVTTSIIVPSRQQVSKYVTELFSSSLPSDFIGTLAVTSAGSSPLPVSVIGLRFRGLNFSIVPGTSLLGPTGPLPVIATGIGGNGAVLVPQFAAGGGWATEIVIGNTGAGSLTVRVDLFKDDGTPLTTTLNGLRASSFMNLTIPPSGVLALAPRDRNGDDDF